MSLELIDRILESWEDPNYEGITEQLAFNKFRETNLDIDINKKMIKDIEQVRFLKPSIVKMSEYSRDKTGLMQFYKDHNFMQAPTKEIIKAYRMMSFPSQYELDRINRYLNNETKLIMQVGFGEGLRSINFLENSNANLVIFSDFKQEYSFYGRHFLEEMYPLRQVVIFGLTKSAIPNFSLDQKAHVKFDIIHYANSRKYYEIYEEILSCSKYTTENTLLILDGVCPHIPAGTGPYVAMNKLIKEGILTFVEHIKLPSGLDDSDGRKYNAGMAVLKFTNRNNDNPGNKLDTKIYKEIEINMPLQELTNFIVDNYENENPVGSESIQLYVDKLIKAGVELDDTIKKYLKEYYSLSSS